MSELRQHLTDYLELRRGLGFKLERDGRLLPEFVDFTEAEGLDHVTTDAALAWATRPSQAHPDWWANRLGMVRVFAKYLVPLDPRTEVPPADELAARQERRRPHIYTETEIASLIAAARSMPTPLRAATYSTLIGLLFVTGMRVGEAIALDDTDVDWDQAIVHVRHTKFDKSRLVPVHATTLGALRSYLAARDRAGSRRRSSASLFVSLSGSRLFYSNVQFTFARLLSQVGLVTHASRPRLHDLRHSFAVRTLSRWQADGGDVTPRLPALSTYLGHVAPSSTYWYQHATPELLGMAAARLDEVLGDLS
jgi:integrase